MAEQLRGFFRDLEVRTDLFPEQPHRLILVVERWRQQGGTPWARDIPREDRDWLTYGSGAFAVRAVFVGDQEQPAIADLWGSQSGQVSHEIFDHLAQSENDLPDRVRAEFLREKARREERSKPGFELERKAAGLFLLYLLEVATSQSPPDLKRCVRCESLFVPPGNRPDRKYCTSYCRQKRPGPEPVVPPEGPIGGRAWALGPERPPNPGVQR